MAKELQPCGTEAAYRRHRRRDEDCAECREARAARKREADDERRAEAVQRAHDARPAETSDMDRDEVLDEVLSILRGQLREAPPQSVAGIAKQIRDTIDAMGKKPTPGASAGSDDIARRRAEREARRSAVNQ